MSRRKSYPAPSIGFQKLRRNLDLARGHAYELSKNYLLHDHPEVLKALEDIVIKIKAVQKQALTCHSPIMSVSEKMLGDKEKK